LSNRIDFCYSRPRSERHRERARIIVIHVPIKTKSALARCRFNSRRFFVLAIAIFCGMQTSADAVTDSVWQNSSLGDWFFASNWSSALGVPNAGIGARIGNGGTALINAPSAQAAELFIGAPTTTGSSGTLLMGASGGNRGSLTVASDIHIGYSNTTGFVGNGNVTVSAGASLLQQSGNLNIGEGSHGSTGSLTITDANSFMTTAAPTFIGLGNSHGSLTVQNGGQIVTGPAELADGASSSGAATVAGSSLWFVEGGFTVGYAGSGTLAISGGGTLLTGGTTSTLNDTSVAAFAGSTGSVTVTGAGSGWYTANLFLGGRDGNSGQGFQGGNGSLNITSGGLVQADNVKFFGGALQVDNGSLTTPGLQVVGGKTPPALGGPVGDMVVGNSTTGRMEIVSGVVYCNKGYVGILSGSEGYAYVTGNNSLWQLSGSLFVGNQGNGTVELRGGANVATDGNCYIGFSANTVGNVIVAGSVGSPGSGDYFSSLYNTAQAGSLYVGGNAGGPGGSGVLRLENFSLVQFSATTVYSTGGLAIGGNRVAFNSALTILGGFIQFVLADNTIFPNDFTLGTGGVQVYTSGHPSTLGGKLSGSGGLTKGGGGSLGVGTLTLTGASTYTGATAVTAGTLLVNGSITSPVTVSSGATLGGSGAVGAVTVNSGGIVAPGNSPGKLTVNGNYTQTSGAILNIELGGATAGSGFDQIAASGIASVSGILNVSLVNDFRPNVGDTFHIITSNGETGNFSTINSTGFTVRSDVSASGVVLTVTGIDPWFHIISIARSGTDVAITYNATGGKTYRLERKLAITDATWQSIAGVSDSAPTVNGPSTFTDPGAIGLGKAFYRVRLLP
jgi:T5SS/PEP-CTERM-associated repeat protein/autotransporter-associated beta strand protein